MKRLMLLFAFFALPAAAKVARPEVRSRIQSGTTTALADLDMALRSAPPRRLQLERIAPMLDGLTVLQLDHDRTSAPRKVVLKPDFASGPGASFAVNF